MIRWRALVAVLVVWIASTQGSRAQVSCELDPNQQVPNCSFEVGDPPTSWILNTGDSFGSSPSARHGDASALVGASYFGGFIATVSTECFQADFSAGYGFGAYFRHESGSISGRCEAVLMWYADAACTNPTSFQQGNQVVLVGSWMLSAGTTAPVGTHARLALRCTSGYDFVVRVDDAFAGPGLTVPVTLQRFAVE